MTQYMKLPKEADASLVFLLHNFTTSTLHLNRAYGPKQGKGEMTQNYKMLVSMSLRQEKNKPDAKL